uniref:TEA domain-containing protein n=1 Tax=Canis lupus familiaris TaxID=9615 RepID=A0A8C0TME5_CANLF
MEATVPCAYILGRDRSSRDRRPRRTARAGGARVGALAAGLVPASWLPGAGVLGWEPREPGGQQPLLRAGRPPFPRLPGLARGAPAGSADAEGARVPQGPPGTPRPRGRLWAPGARSRSLGRGRRERQERGAGGSGSRKRAAARGRRESARGSRGGRGRGGGRGEGSAPRAPPRPAAPSPLRPVSSPRGRGRAAPPCLPPSVPQLRASHTSPHSAHSRLPPFKLQAWGRAGPELPAPRSRLPAPAARGCVPRTGPTGAPPSGALEGKAGTITSNEWSPPNSPEGSNVSGGSQALDKPIDNDAEGVWSPDIEQSFQEALAIYPPCGRRKIILSDEGKMYGRNELIARYIKLRTGKTRTRKQVSSHIQVLARRKAREIQAKLKDQAAKDKALQSMAPMSPAQAISATAFHSKMALARGPGHPAVSGFWQGALPGQAGTSHDVKPFSQQTYTVQPSLPLPGFESPAGPTPSPSAPPAPPWQGRSVASSKLWMLEFSAFLEQQQDPDTYNKHLFVHIGQSSPSYSDPYLEAVDIRQIYDKFPEKKGGLKELFERGPSNAFFLVKFWADLNTNIEDEGSSFYGVSSQYESPENMIITCSTKVCSFGKQVVEKVETEYARYENGHYSYRIHRSPLCEYMINFIHKLKHLPEKYMMNSVLENFTILQVVTNRDTQETLLCIAYVFEVSASEHGAQHHIYRLVKE